MMVGLPQARVVVRVFGAIAAVMASVAAFSGCGGGAQMRRIDAGATGGMIGTGGTGATITGTHDAGVDHPGATVPTLGNGDTCTANADCKSGFCVDAVCCESACTGDCLTCAGMGS